MALRHYLFVFSILLIVTLGNAFNMKYVMDRLNAIEAKFDAENQRRRSEMEALERKFVTENQLRRSETDASERKLETEINLRRLEVLELFRIISQLTGDEMLNKTEEEFPVETSTPMQLLTTVSPSLDKYKQSHRVPDHRNFHSYLILGAKLEKQENVKTRTELTSIGKKLEKDYAIFRSSIINEIRHFTHDITQKQNLVVHETRESLSLFKSDVEASILELSNSLHQVNQTSVESMEHCSNFSLSLSEQTATVLSKMIEEKRLNLTSFLSDVESSIHKLSNDFQTVSQTTMENCESSNNVSYALTVVMNERLNNLSAFVTNKQSELRNETRQSLISLKSDIETSFRNLSNDLHTVNQTAIKSIERCNDVIDSLANVTNERLNNLSASVTETQSELRNESRQSLTSLKSDVEKYIQKLSNDFLTMNQSAIKNDERIYNIIDSLANVTNERLKNLSAFVTETHSELINESRQSLILFKFDVETTIQKLSNDFHTVNVTALENVERCHNVSDSLTIVTNERLNNLYAFVTKAQSELRNESRLSLISLKSDFKTSIQNISNDLHTVNQTTMKNVKRFDSLTYSNTEHLNNLVSFVTSTQSGLRNETRQSLILLKSDVDTSIEKLSNDFLTVNVTAIKSVESCKNVRDSLTIVTNERLNNLSALVTTTQSELRNETRQSLISLKSDFETSIRNLSNDFRTVSQTAITSIERCNNASNSLTIVTNERDERLNNLSAFVNETKSDLKNEARQSMISLKSDVETSIQKLSNNFHTVNITAIKSVERCNNVSDSLTMMANERLNNLRDFMTTTQSELRNEARQSIISFKSDFEMSIQKLSNNFQTVNITAIKSVGHCNNVSDSLTMVTNDLHSVKTILQDKFIYVESCKNVPKSGAYMMFNSKLATPLRVYCDQTTDLGGWLVIQRRVNGSVDFYRNWADYKTGFGFIENEFWIGNDNLHALTSSGLNELRIDMTDFNGNKAYAKYINFKVHPESDLYKLEVGGHSGNAGDSLQVHNRMAFSTKDRDNDEWSGGSCSEDSIGAWWYISCAASNLNGQYYHDGNSHGNGIFWYFWKEEYYSLKTVEMKIR